MRDYLSFHRMITPVFIQIIFWLAVLAVVIVGIVQIGKSNAAAGVGILIFGPLVIRIYAELLMVIFRIQDDVAAIRAGKSAAPAGASTAVSSP